MNIFKKCIHDGICHMQKKSVTRCSEYNKGTEKRGVWLNCEDVGNGNHKFVCSNCCMIVVGRKKPYRCQWCGSKNK